MIVRLDLDPCKLDIVEACGYRDQSYDDAGTGGGVLARAGSDELGGAVVLLFFAVIFGAAIRSLRRYWASPSFPGGGDFQ